MDKFIENVESLTITPMACSGWNLTINVDSERLQRLLLTRNHRFKRLVFDNCCFGKDLNQALQIFIPLTQEKYELSERLKNEITNQLKQTKQKWEIEALKNKIKSEVCNKYKKVDQFDENELTYDKNEKNSKEWRSKIEMLAMNEIDKGMLMHANTAESKAKMEKIVKNHLKAERIKTGLSQLKCLSYSEPFDKDFFDSAICEHIVYHIGNQLKSLHINEVIDFGACPLLGHIWHHKCACTRDAKNSIENDVCSKKMFANLEHLCLGCDYCDTIEATFDSDSFLHFWQKVCKCLFPSLKYLNIETDWDTNNTNFIFGNDCHNIVPYIISLIENGLESFCLKLNHILCKHIFDTFDSKNESDMPNEKFYFCTIANLFQRFVKVFENVKSTQKKKHSFVLKMDLNIDFTEEGVGIELSRHCQKYARNKFCDIFHAILLVYLSMLKCFENVMLI